MGNPFSQYAHPFEKQVNSFFYRAAHTKNSAKTHNNLLKLMQKDTIVTNLWMEKRFKNYRYLNKTHRKQLYQHATDITTQFDSFYRQYNISTEHLQHSFQSHNVEFPENATAQIRCMSAIMAFLQPGKLYRYIPTASFGKLLRNPATDILEGDCNQIVTLYAYLYSRYFPISELQVKVLPDHVCLHMSGIDIEATNATWALYSAYDFVGPITELLAINLLDLSDFREMQAKTTRQTMLKAAQLAYHLSSIRELVTRNLRAAYYNMALEKAKQQNFTAALLNAQQAGDANLVVSLSHNASLYEAKKGNMARARSHAKRSGNTELQKHILLLEGERYMKKKQYNQARKIFTQAGNQDMVRYTFQEEYNALLKKIPKTLSTVEAHKKYTTTYKKLLLLAQRGGLTEHAKQIQSILKQLK